MVESQWCLKNIVFIVYEKACIVVSLFACVLAQNSLPGNHFMNIFLFLLHFAFSLRTTFKLEPVAK